jgi:hypothetical protein
MEKLKLIYSCYRCGLRDSHVMIEQRMDDEDVIDWMLNVHQMILEHHRVVSTGCRCKEFSDIKIPDGALKNVGRRAA